MRESEKGARHWAVAFIGAAGGRGRGGSTAASAWKRETGEEGGGPGAVVGGRHQPVADGRGWAEPSRGGQALMCRPQLQCRPLNLIRVQIQTNSKHLNFQLPQK
jgi:hypothetical protein